MVALRGAGLTADYCSTKGKHFPDILKQSADLIVAAGGDGAVAKVLKKMPDRKVPVTILPLGTANNIARSLGVAGKPKELLAGLKDARKQRFDIGLASGQWGRKLFVEAVGLGLLTDAMVRIDSINIERADGVKLGRDTVRKVLSEAKPIRIDMSVDGRSLGDDVLLVEIMNIRYAGPGLALAPPDGLGDGLFDIVCVTPEQRKDMLAWLGATAPNTPPPVTLRQGRKVSLTWEGSQLRLDDDCPSASQRGNRISVELEREAVTILVPPTKQGENGKVGKPRRTKTA
jgi:diacylglycerol kinase family enzyme